MILLKNLRWRNCLGLLGRAQFNCKHVYEREAEARESESERNIGRCFSAGLEGGGWSQEPRKAGDPP